jgi:hypothetical protein
MKIEIKEKRKSILRDVLESYRELPAYKDALVDIYTTITGIRIVPEGHNIISDATDSWLLSEILSKIQELRTGLNNAENGCNTTN